MPGQWGGRLRFADHRQRPAGDRILGELAAVSPAARKGEEEEARLHAPRIVLQSANFQLGKLRRKWLCEPHVREYAVELHLLRVHLLNWTRIRSPGCKGDPGAGN